MVDMEAETIDLDGIGKQRVEPLFLGLDGGFCRGLEGNEADFIGNERRSLGLDGSGQAAAFSTRLELFRGLVDLIGIEPMTSSMPWNEANRKL